MHPHFTVFKTRNERVAHGDPEAITYIFGKCMTRKVVDHVFNGTANDEDFSAVLDEFKSTHKIKSMLKVAMVRYAERNKNGAPVVSPARR